MYRVSLAFSAIFLFIFTTFAFIPSLAAADTAPTVTFTEYNIPTGDSHPFGMIRGADGNIWFTEHFVGKIGKITPDGSISEFPLANVASYPAELTVGSDNNVWFTEAQGSNIGKITSNGTITEYPIGNFSAGIAVGSNTNVWFAEINTNKLGNISEIGSISEVTVPTSGSSYMRSMAKGPDGSLWFTEDTINKIGHIKNDGTIIEYPIPTLSSGPQRITQGPDGNMWFAEYTGNQVANITPGGVITEYSVPTSQGRPVGITTGPDGALWFTESEGHKIGRITVAGEITEYAIPTPSSSPNSIVMGQDNTLWFTEYFSNKIGKMTISVPAVPPRVGALSQYQEDGVTPIPSGANFVGNNVVLKTDVSDQDSLSVRLEVEVKPTGVVFDGNSTVFSATTTASSIPFATTTIAVSVKDLIPSIDQYAANGTQRTFHWRVRAIDSEGNVSGWAEYSPPIASFTAHVVPLYTQVDDPLVPGSSGWTTDSYDHDGANIHAEGCAISSVAMIAHYYGIDYDVNGNLITPRTINEWLKSHNGYTPDGLVIWDKIANGYLNINMPGGSYQRVAFSGYRISPSIADISIARSTPVIARKDEAGHYFVVANTLAAGTASSTYLVRDPYWYLTNTLNDAKATNVHAYNNTYSYANIFTKLDTPKLFVKHAELVLSGRSPIELLVTDPQGRREGIDPVTHATYNEIPDARYYNEEPYHPSDVDLDPATQHRTKTIYIPWMLDGAYSVKVTGTGVGSYTLDAQMEDAVGSTTTTEIVATTTSNQVATYRVLVTGGKQTFVPQDVTPPEAFIAFSTTTKKIVITGTDNLSTTTVSTKPTSIVISDASSNTLTLNISKNQSQPNTATLVIPSIVYSSGTTTNAATTMRYFWATDKKGAYTLFVSAIRTPSTGIIAVYIPALNKTYVVNATMADDSADLSTQVAKLVTRKVVKIYTGLYIPSVSTNKGVITAQ